MSDDYEWVEVAPGRRKLVKKTGRPLLDDAPRALPCRITEDYNSPANTQMRRYGLDRDEQAIPLALPGKPIIRLRKSASNLERRELVAAEYRKHGHKVSAQDVEFWT